MINLVAVIGKAGSGKNTILSNFINKNKETKFITVLNHDLGLTAFETVFNIVIPFTTRPMRPGEREGVDYHFITKERALQLIDLGQVAQYAVFNDWIYGTLFEDYDEHRINLGIYTPKAINNLNPKDNFNITTVYIIAKDKDRMLRQLNREKNPDVHEIARRFLADEIDFDETIIEKLPNVIRIENPDINSEAFIHTPNPNYIFEQVATYNCPQNNELIWTK